MNPTRDCFDYIQFVANIATSVGVIFAIWQGIKASRLAENAAISLRRDQQRALFGRFMDMCLSSGKIDSFITPVKKAIEGGFSDFDITYELAESMIAKGGGLEGGGIDRNNAHLAATEMLDRIKDLIKKEGS